MLLAALLRTWSARRTARRAAHRHPLWRSARPVLETLEERLPPGDLLLTAMSAPLLTPSLANALGDNTSGTTTDTSDPAATAYPYPNYATSYPAPYDPTLTVYYAYDGSVTVSYAPTYAPAALSDDGAYMVAYQDYSSLLAGGSSGAYSVPAMPTTTDNSAPTFTDPMPMTSAPVTTPAPPVPPMPGSPGGGSAAAPTTPGEPAVPAMPGTPEVPPMPGTTAPTDTGPSAPYPMPTPMPTPVNLALNGVTPDNSPTGQGDITNSATPTVFGTGTPGASLALQVDGQTVARGAVAGDGTWSLAVQTPLTDGGHMFTVTGVTADGGSGQTGAYVTVLSAAPVVTLSGNDHIIDNPQVTVSVDGAGLAAGPYKVALDVDSAGTGTFSGPNDLDQADATAYSSQVTLTPETFPAGNHLVRARVTDAAGNVGLSAPKLVYKAVSLDASPAAAASSETDGSVPDTPPVPDDGAPPDDGSAPAPDSAGGTPKTILVSPAGDFTESEPNNTPATANVITLTPGTEVHGTGAISTPADVDYYKFTVPQRTGVFFYVDANEDAISTLNSTLTLYDNTGTTQLDTNDNGYDFDTGWPLQDRTASAATGDAGLYRDLNAGTYYIKVAGVAGSQGAYQLKILASTNYASTPPVLNSKPGAKATLYLDFTGYSHTDDWNSGAAYTVPAFDINGNPNEFTPQEQLVINNIWSVVAEDYSPFDINVTTAPTNASVQGQSMRVVIGGNTTDIGEPPVSPTGGQVGVAFIGSFANNAKGDPCFVWAGEYYGPGAVFGTNNTQVQNDEYALEVGNVAAHEPGHTFGLNHFAPLTPPVHIMETTTGAARLVWNAATTDPAEPPVMFQDDMAIISNATNGFGYRAPTAGTTLATATPLTAAGSTYTFSGVIRQPTDANFFQIMAGATPGTTVLTASVNSYVNDLKPVLTVYDAGGNVVASADVAGVQNATLSLSLTPGAIYFVEVSSHGAAGQAGQYTLTATLPAPPPAPPPPTPPPGGPGTPGPRPIFVGDIYEPDETEDTAYNFGVLQQGSSNSQTYQQLTINIKPDGAPDYDWYTWTAATAGTFSVNFAVTAGGTPTSQLEIHLFTVDGSGTLVEQASDSVGAGGSATPTVALAAGQQVWVNVKGVNSSFGVHDQGTYNMQVTLT